MAQGVEDTYSLSGNPLSSRSPEGAPPEGMFPGGLVATFGRLPPTALLLLSIVSVQLGSALATVLLVDLGAAGTAFSSSVFAAAVLTLAIRPMRAAALITRLRRHAGLILLFGLVNAAMALPYFLALRTIPLGVVATVTFLGPLGVAVVASRRAAHFVLIGIAALGVALLAPEIGTPLDPVGLDPVGLDPVGLGWAALSALGWGAFVLVSQRVGAVFPRSDGLCAAFWIASALLLPFALREGSLSHAAPLAWLGGFGVALLAVVLPLAMEFQALRRMSARSYGILVTLEPAAGALVGAICLGQPAGPRMVIAVACVMLAALGITLSDRRP